YLYSLEKAESYPVTDGWHTAYEPAFSSDGKYLFFVSNRDFAPFFSRTEWNHAYRDMARIYLATLAKDTPSPFQPRSDEAGAEEPKPAPAGKKGDPLKVDVDGLHERILQLPVDVSGYRNLQAAGSTLYYIRQGDNLPAASLRLFDLAQRKEA